MGMEGAENAAIFNRVIRDLIKRLEAKCREDLEIANLDRLKKRINLLKSTMGEGELVRRSSPIMITYAEKILDPSPDERDRFFLELDVRKEYAKYNLPITVNEEFIFSLIASIRKHYTRARVEERQAIYTDVKTLLTCCLKDTIKNN